FFLFLTFALPTFYTLSLHDALPIYQVVVLVRTVDQARLHGRNESEPAAPRTALGRLLTQRPPKAILRFGTRPVEGRVQQRLRLRDRKSTRLNSSHGSISYAVFCLKK